MRKKMQQSEDNGTAEEVTLTDLYERAMANEALPQEAARALGENNPGAVAVPINGAAFNAVRRLRETEKPPKKAARGLINALQYKKMMEDRADPTINPKASEVKNSSVMENIERIFNDQLKELLREDLQQTKRKLAQFTASNQKSADLEKKLKQMQKEYQEKAKILVSFDPYPNLLKLLNDEVYHTKLPQEIKKILSEPSKQNHLNSLTEFLAKDVQILGTQDKVELLESFILAKKTSGTSEEKRLYENMDPEKLLVRIFEKRAICFMNPADTFKLRKDLDLSLSTIVSKYNELPQREKNRIGSQYILDPFISSDSTNTSKITIKELIDKYNKHLLEEGNYPKITISLKATDVYNLDPHDSTFNYLTEELVSEKEKKSKQSTDSSETGFPQKQDLVGNPFPYELLPISDYLTYDEIQLSALLGVANPSLNINDGNRNNKGIPATGEKEISDLNPFAYIVAQVGARFEKPGVMEYAHMLITPTQNTEEHGYGTELSSSESIPQSLQPHWAKFYGLEYFPTYEEVAKKLQEQQLHEDQEQLIQLINDPQQRPLYLPINQGNSEAPIYLNITAYQKRIKDLAYEYLSYANETAKKNGKQAYVIATGLGLGVWSIDRNMQNTILQNAYKQVIEENNFPNIATIEFNFLNQVIQQEKIEEIDVVYSKSPPFSTTAEITRPSDHSQQDGSEQVKSDTLDRTQNNQIVFFQVAYDGNSAPGNEAHRGNLNGSADPATFLSAVFWANASWLVNEVHLRKAINELHLRKAILEKDPKVLNILKNNMRTENQVQSLRLSQLQNFDTLVVGRGRPQNFKINDNSSIFESKSDNRRKALMDAARTNSQQVQQLLPEETTTSKRMKKQ